MDLASVSLLQLNLKKKKSPSKEGRSQRIRFPINKISGPTARADWLKIFILIRRSLTLSCTVSVAWSERVNGYNLQIMILPRKTKKHMQHSRAPGPVPDRRGLVICTGLPPLLSSPLVLKQRNQEKVKYNTS